MSDRITPADIVDIDEAPRPRSAPPAESAVVRLGKMGRPLVYAAAGDGWVCADGCTCVHTPGPNPDDPYDSDGSCDCPNCGLSLTVCHRCGRHECIDHTDGGEVIECSECGREHGGDNAEQWWT